MDLKLRGALAELFVSNSQKARVLSEDWVSRNMYCPACGAAAVRQYANNRPVPDFHCADCREEFELKSKAGRFSSTVPDGAYRTMIERITSSTNPNLLLLSYDPIALVTVDVIVVPKHFLVREIIRERPPLRSSARRAGWIGCNIALDGIPERGRIALIGSGKVTPKEQVSARWRSSLFMREQSLAGRRWLMSVMRCIDRIGRQEFSIEDVYRFECELGLEYPANRHIRPKIRQQLQVLRDRGYLEFCGRGQYRLQPLGA